MMVGHVKKSIKTLNVKTIVKTRRFNGIRSARVSTGVALAA